MATESFVWDESYSAGADLRTKQFMPVKFSAARTVTVAGANDRYVGVLLNKPNTGEAARVRHIGMTKAIVDGTTPIAAGDILEADASNRLVKCTTDKHNTGAVAIEASSAVGDVISVLVWGVFTASI